MAVVDAEHEQAGYVVRRSPGGSLVQLVPCGQLRAADCYQRAAVGEPPEDTGRMAAITRYVAQGSLTWRNLHS
jgi:hypothetical protein